MKKLAAILCLSALTTGAFAQGLINFFNSASTLVSSGTAANATALPAGAAGSFYFGLITSAVGANSFTFANVYGTNQTFAGRFTGGGNVPVTGWAAGTSRDFKVVGWSASLGPTFQNSWLTAGPTSGFFGVSALGTGAAGGTDASGNPIPNLNIFGGVSGIQTGFNLAPVPEPTSMALAGLGAAALLIFRRRK